MNRMSKALAIAACAAAALSLCSAGAEESKVTVVKAGEPLNAMKVARDKDTGKLRPATAAEIAQMGRASTPGYAPSIVVVSHPVTTVVTHADGSITARRSLADLDHVTAQRNPDGTLAMHHGAKAGAAANASKPTE